MDKNKIMEEIAKRVNRDIGEISESTKFADDLNLDSIDLVEMLMEIEESYNIEISDEKAIKIKTIGDFVTAVMEEINE